MLLIDANQLQSNISAILQFSIRIANKEDKFWFKWEQEWSTIEGVKERHTLYEYMMVNTGEWLNVEETVMLTNVTGTTNNFIALRGYSFVDYVLDNVNLII